MSWYPFLKTVHIVAVIAWMAGVLYLFRLFVYHRSEKEKVVRQRFEFMEYRLYRFIAFPASIIAFLAGLGLVMTNPAYYGTAGWFHTKFWLAMLVLALTHLSNRFRRKLSDDSQRKQMKSDRFYRILNEVPAVLMVIIVYLVVYKPF